MTPDAEHGGDQRTVSMKTMELVVAAALMALACVIMWDNWRIGARWGSDGPQAGYFPFYIGLILFVTSAGTLLTSLFDREAGQDNFVGRAQLVQVLRVLVPTAVFVVMIGFTGIYVAAAVFIGFFMWWLGKYPLYKIVPIAIAVPLFLFMMFEIWFLVPLPKGPIEMALGY